MFVIDMSIQQIFDEQTIEALKHTYIENNIIKSKTLVYKTVMKKFPEFNAIYVQYFSENAFREIMYSILKDIPEIPKCKNPNCNKKTKLRNYVQGFQKCCSKKCVAEYQHLSDEHKQKCKKSAIVYYQNHPANKLTRLKNYIITTDSNYYIIYDYCKHGNIRLYKKTANNINKLKNTSFCYKCNEKLFNDYIPTETEIMVFQNKFPDFYSKHHHSMKYNWWMLYYPQYFKIIITYFNKHIRLYDKGTDNLLELYYVFLNKITKRPICTVCDHPVDFSYSCICYKKFCNEHLYGFNESSQEKTLEMFIKSLDITYIKHDRLQIGQELDFLFPDKNMAIEFNGCWWHCEKFKDKKYHYNKWKACREKGIQLLFIWEDDLLYKENIIHNIIKTKLGLTKHTIYANECEVKEISYSESKQFINYYHLEGYTIDKIRLGLFYNNELVSVMTFSKSRFNKDEIEIKRYCVKHDYQIVDGTTKLFNHFINNYDYNKIVSYAEADTLNEDIYKQLDFQFISIKEHFKWLYRGIRYNYYAQIKNKNNDMIYKCYSAGTLKYMYNDTP